VLQSALEENRRLTASILRGYPARLQVAQGRVLAEHIKVANKLIAAPIVESPFSSELVGQLNDSEYLDFSAPAFDRFERLEKSSGIPLEGLSRILPVLVKLGANNQDFSGIYCERCDFGGDTFHSGVHFDRSFLADASFSNSHLEKASFTNAQLDGTLFFHAYLAGSHMDYHGTWSSIDARRSGTHYPLLECADLRGADLSGVTLLSFSRTFNQLPVPTETVRVPALVLAQIDASTKMDSFRAFVETNVTDSYSSKQPGGSARKRLELNSFPSGIENPLLDPEVDKADVWRTEPTDEERSFNREPTTSFDQSTYLVANNLDSIAPSLHPGLQGFLNQPSLLRLPLIQKFENAISATTPKEKSGDSPRHWRSSPPYSCSDSTPPPIAALRVLRKVHSKSVDP